MLERIKERIVGITDEVKELHPLLEELFRKHPKILQVEYTHGPDEMGADFVLTHTHDVLGTPEHIGVVAKLGKIHKNFEDVERQIKECVKVPRKVNGGKREIVLSEVWVVCTNSITEGAKRKIHAEYPGTNVQFVNGNYLSSMVDRFVPEYWSNVELPLSTYLGSLKSRTEELDKSLDLIQLEGSPVYIEQDVLRVETDPYQAGDGKKRNRATRVNFIEELNKNKLY